MTTQDFDYMKKIIPVIFAAYLLSFAARGDDAGSNDFSYVFHLVYNNSQLYIDSTYESSYDIIAEKYEQVVYQNPFRGQIKDSKDVRISEFQYDPGQGGEISAKAPYSPSAAKAIFYDNQNNQLLILSLSESSFCNNDNKCDSDIGEETSTCPADCPKSLFSDPIFLEIIVGIIAVILVIGLAIWMKRRGRISPPQPPVQPQVY